MSGSVQPFEYYVVLDFEATCDSGSALPVQEVIEFPSVLLRSTDMTVVDEFESFVRPQHLPVLTPFCMELTGIRQEDVDSAAPFHDVFARHANWLAGHGLPIDSPTDDSRFAFVLCGDWDLGTMLPSQCSASIPPIEAIPRAYRQWVNVKRPFADWKGVAKAPGMAGMLRELDLELIGRHHRGIDDCRNIARIVRALADCGRTLEITTRLAASRYPPLRLVLERDGSSHNVELTNRSLGTLAGLASGLYRRQVAAFYNAGGEELTSDMQLLEFSQDSRLSVELR